MIVQLWLWAIVAVVFWTLRLGRRTMTAKERVMLECPECDGTGGSRGSADNMDIEVCYLCDGDGWIWATLTRTWGVTDE